LNQGQWTGAIRSALERDQVPIPVSKWLDIF